MTLPNFLYIGSPKCGSTWIFNALRAHPQVFVPEGKYVLFFTRYQHRGVRWYENQFSDATPKQLAVGEATTLLLFNKRAVQSMHQLLPTAKLIISARNPIQRDWSAWRFKRRNGENKESFRAAVDGDDAFISRASNYMDHIDYLESFYPRECYRVFLFDDLVKDPGAFAASIYDFLGVDSSFNFTQAEKKAYGASSARVQWLATVTKRGAILARDLGMARAIGAVKRSKIAMKMLYRPVNPENDEQMLLEDWLYLADRYRDGVARLGAHLNRDLSHWLEPPKRLYERSAASPMNTK